MFLGVRVLSAKEVVQSPCFCLLRRVIVPLPTIASFLTSFGLRQSRPLFVREMRDAIDLRGGMRC